MSQSSLSAGVVRCFRDMIEGRRHLQVTVKHASHRHLHCSAQDSYSAVVNSRSCKLTKIELARFLSGKKELQEKGYASVCWDLISGGDLESIDIEQFKRALCIANNDDVTDHGGHDDLADTCDFKLVQREIELEFDSVPTFQGYEPDSKKDDKATKNLYSFFTSIKDSLLESEKLRIKLYNTPGFSLHEFYRVLTMLSPHDTVLKSMLEVEGLPHDLEQFIGLENRILSYKRLRRALTPVCQSLADLYGSGEGYFNINEEKYAFSTVFIKACGEMGLSGLPKTRNSPDKQNSNQNVVPQILGFDDKVPTKINEQADKNTKDRSLVFPNPKSSFSNLKGIENHQPATIRLFNQQPYILDNKALNRRPLTSREYPRTEVKERPRYQPRTLTDQRQVNYRSQQDQLSSHKTLGTHLYDTENKDRKLIESKYRSGANLDITANNNYALFQPSSSRVYSGHISANGGRIKDDNAYSSSHVKSSLVKPLTDQSNKYLTRPLPSSRMSDTKQRSLIRY